MRSVWLVYRPARDYEDGFQPFAIFENKRDAGLAADRVNAYVAKLRARVNRLADPDEDGLDADESASRWMARQELIRRAHWPLSICLEVDIFRSEIDRVVDVMPLPHYLSRPQRPVRPSINRRQLPLSFPIAD